METAVGTCKGTIQTDDDGNVAAAAPCFTAVAANIIRVGRAEGSCSSGSKVSCCRSGSSSIPAAAAAAATAPPAAAVIG